MRFSLIPRETKFFDMFDEVAAIQTRAAGKFLDMVKEHDRLDARSRCVLPRPRRTPDRVSGDVGRAGSPGAWNRYLVAVDGPGVDARVYITSVIER